MKSLVGMLLLLVACPLYVKAELPPLRIALVQAGLVWGDVDANLTAFDKRVNECGRCDLIVFPELFTSGCEMKKGDREKSLQQKNEVALRFDSIVSVMQHWAARTGALVVGSTIYKEDGRYYNRLIAAYPDGRWGYYDKHNCFKKGIFSPGTERLIVNWKGWRLATFICYDLRFPDWSRSNGAYDAALYIANWPQSRAADWQRLLAERAKENAVFVVGVNCVGTAPAGLAYQGGSCIVCPSGNVVARCQDDKEEVLTVEVGGQDF